MITRRGLVAAGAGVLLAGCGADDEPVAPDARLLAPVLAAEAALVEAYERVPGRLGRALAARASAHAERLRAAGAAPGPAGAATAGGDPLEAALALQRRSMAACVAAVGVVSEPARRALVADVLTGGAEHAAILLTRLGRDPLPTAFPDGREA